MDRLNRRVDLVVSNFRAWLPMLAHLPGARFEERDGVTLWTSDTPLPLFNGVWGAPTDSDRIDGILEGFEARPFVWLVPPPENIDDALTRRGLQVSRLPGMAVDLAALPPMVVPGGVEVSAVDGDDELLRIATTVAYLSNGFPEDAVPPILEMLGRIEERDRFQTFLATVDGEPAAASALLVTGEAAGLFDVGTAPRFRRRGLGALVSLAALEAGRQRGCRVGVLESTADGEPSTVRSASRRSAGSRSRPGPHSLTATLPESHFRCPSGNDPASLRRPSTQDNSRGEKWSFVRRAGLGAPAAPARVQRQLALFAPMFRVRRRRPVPSVRTV